VTNVDVLANRLTKIGVDVQTAYSGRQALEMMHQNVPDIVFTDIRMPDMDGTELLKHILKKESAKTIKVVATTASVFEHQRQEYLDMGFDAFINKPIQFEEIYACMSKLLGVIFEFDKVQVGGGSQTETDWQNIRLPKELHTHLKTAAEDQSITDLRRHLQTLEQMEHMQPLVIHLSGLVQKFDIEGIKNVLNSLPSE